MFEPAMRKPDMEIHWDNTFMFQSSDGRCESLVWRKYATEIAVVHNFGCAKQTADRDKGRTRCAYIGAITAIAKNIRSLRSAKGIQFLLLHVPDEGNHHAHITFSDNSTKNDRNELKYMLKAVFGNLEEHVCQ